MSTKAVRAGDRVKRAVNKAKKEAQKILEQFGCELPVDINAIVKAHNITVRAEPLEDTVSGMLVIKDGSAIIGINESHHPNRRRFTLAHELGHYVLHGNASQVFIDAAPVFYRDEVAADGSRIQEIQANTFAAELLMPEEVLKDLFQKKPMDPHDDVAVKRMASMFEVSVQALTIRLTKLGLVGA